ncbi:MAG: hydrogenase formation protein HypD [bacterium]
MNLDEFKNSKDIVQNLKEAINRCAQNKLTIMEVCGTHTMALFKHGIKELLPPTIRFISGPGCPVCVTDNLTIDKALFLAQQDDIIITTFGDMIRVPGTKSSLYYEKSQGAHVEIVYSPMIALDLAEKYSDKKIVFIAVGFETTVPVIAATIKEAERRNRDNFFILCAHKTVPNALRALASMERIAIDYFLLPGHVSTIIGAQAYDFLVEECGIGGVIAGFEPVDMLAAIYAILQMKVKGEVGIGNQYTRIVSQEGNRKAQEVIDEVFKPCNANWRGIGEIPNSGLMLREDYGRFDIERIADIDVSFSKEATGCICGEILCGIKTPLDCPFFGERCLPEHPIGPCMVSSEGTCAAYYKYKKI